MIALTRMQKYILAREIAYKGMTHTDESPLLCKGLESLDNHIIKIKLQKFTEYQFSSDSLDKLDLESKI